MKLRILALFIWVLIMTGQVTEVFSYNAAYAGTVVTAEEANRSKAVQSKAIPTGVRLDRSGTVTLDIDKTLTLTAVLKPADAQTSLAWKSSNKKIATVSSTGVVTPKKVGTATITVTTNTGKKKASVKVKVVDPYKPTGISLNKTGTVELPTQESLSLVATLKPSTAKSGITWKSSKKSIATVSSSGVVKAVKPGTVTITATTNSGKKTASVKVKVTNPQVPTAIKLNKTGTVDVVYQKTLALTGTLTPSGAKSSVTWTSSNTKVAEVSDNGVVTAKADGTATITAKTTRGGQTASVNIRVTGALACGVSTHYTGDGKTHTKQACGHYACDGKNHAAESCKISGHYACDGKNHAAAGCKISGHYACDGKNHAAAGCGTGGHYTCDSKNHAAAGCGTSGHYACDGKNHAKQACGHFLCAAGNHAAAVCETSGHYVCGGKNHAKQACGHFACVAENHATALCGTSGHYVCDGKNHATAICETNGHYMCDGENHAKQACGHFVCTAGNHAAALCGTSGHYVCDGKNHATATCETSGHYMCDGENHAMQACGHYGCDGGNHGVANCGLENHYACDNNKLHSYSSEIGNYTCDSTIYRFTIRYFIYYNNNYYGYPEEDFDKIINAPVGTPITKDDYLIDIPGSTFLKLAPHRNVVTNDPEKNWTQANYITNNITVYSYIIHCLDLDGKDLLTPVQISMPAGWWINESEYIDAFRNALPGYNYVYSSSWHYGVTSNSDTAIYIYFSNGTEESAIPYTIEFVDTDGNALHSPEIRYSALGMWVDIYSFDDIPEFEGYKLTDPHGFEMTSDTESNRIRLIYEKYYPITLHFVDIATQTEIMDTYKITNYYLEGETFYWYYWTEDISGYDFVYTDRGSFTVSSDETQNEITFCYVAHNAEKYEVTVNYVTEEGELLETDDYLMPAGMQMHSEEFAKTIYRYYDDVVDDNYYDYHITFEPSRYEPGILTVDTDESKNVVTVYCEEVPHWVEYRAEAYFVVGNNETYYRTFWIGSNMSGNVVHYTDMCLTIENWYGLTLGNFLRSDKESIVLSVRSSENVIKLYYSIPADPTFMAYDVDIYFKDDTQTYLFNRCTYWGMSGEIVDIDLLREGIEGWEVRYGDFLGADPSTYVIGPLNGALRLYYKVPPWWNGYNAALAGAFIPDEENVEIIDVPNVKKLTIRHADEDGLSLAPDTTREYEVGTIPKLDELAEVIEGYEAVRTDPEEFVVSANEAENVVTIIYREAAVQTPGKGTEFAE